MAADCEWCGEIVEVGLMGIGPPYLHGTCRRECYKQNPPQLGRFHEPIRLSTFVRRLFENLARVTKKPKNLTAI